MGIVVRRVENRVHFFDLLRRIVALRNEKDRKMSRFATVVADSSIIRQPPSTHS